MVKEDMSIQGFPLKFDKNSIDFNIEIVIAYDHLDIVNILKIESKQK